MFGKKPKKEVKDVAPVTPDLVVERPAENAGMPGFTVDPKPATATATEVKDEGIPGFGSIGAPAPAATEPIAAPAAAPAPVKAPTPPAPAEQYQIVETGMAPGEGLYVYKIVTNKYLGELGGVYEA